MGSILKVFLMPLFFFALGSESGLAFQANVPHLKNDAVPSPILVVTPTPFSSVQTPDQTSGGTGRV